MQINGQSPAVPTNGPAAVAAPMETLIQQISSIQAPELREERMANEKFDADVVVIGAGPGGYFAAIRAAQLGAQVIVVEKEFLGGTCLNWGCIPSKVLIASAERYHQVKHAKEFGVTVGDVSLDFAAMMKRKEKVVATQRGGIGALFKKNKIKHVEGFASFVDAHTITVKKGDQTQTITAKSFILATGSSVVRNLPIPGLEGGREEGVWTSDDAVTMPFLPKRAVVVGGGAVGSEFSYVMGALGTEVTLVEMAPTLIPLMDVELGTELGKQLGKLGVKVKTGATLEKVERVGNAWKVSIKKGDDVEVVETDVILLGVGRKANIDGMNLEGVGVKLHRRGVEVVDATLRTNVPNIFAIGDVRGSIQLAHVAEHEGLVAAANAVTGSNKTYDHKVIPNCVYTSPEVASVGLTEAEAKEKGYDVVVGKANFRYFGKAMAIGEVEGFVKVIGEKKYGELLGVHMIGGHVTDLIHEAAVAIKHEATLESVGETIHAHPTMAETVLEAFEDALGHAIHKL